MQLASPFPGTDPWLEQHWGDVHHRLVTYTADQLQPRLPSGLRARMNERVFVEFPDGTDRNMYPDVRVVQRGSPGRPASAPPPASTSAAVAEPLVLHLDDEPMTEGFVEIIDTTSGGKVVTVLEFLSPTNKLAGEGQRLYLQKRRELATGGVSLVEVDLVREGGYPSEVSESRIPLSHRTTYRAWVRRRGERRRVEVYAVPLRSSLPTIRVPLRETDPDVPLDLQGLLDQVYANGGYDDTNYRAEPVPPLSRNDAAWADALLREKGLR